MAENSNKREKIAKSLGSRVGLPMTDIVFTTLRHWPWIIISVLACVGIVYVYLLRIPNVYTRQAELLVKDESKGASSEMDQFSEFGIFKSSTNIPNEISTLQSKDLMEEVVRRRNLSTIYYRKGRFHNTVAYGFDLPVEVRMLNNNDDLSVSFNLEVQKDGKVNINDFTWPGNGGPKKNYITKLSTRFNTPVGQMMVVPTPVYVKGETVDLFVNKLSVGAMRDILRGGLSVKLSNDKGSVLTLSFADQSIARADDVLATLIAVYNEHWIQDKNQIAVSTSNFINDRLGVIESELGNVDNDISSFKSSHLIPDVNQASSMYMEQSQASATAILDVSNQLQMARYIRNYLTNDSHREQLLPANSGIQSMNVQGQISEYNNTMLERNNLLKKSSESNPLVVSLNDELAQQRQAIIRSVDNEIVNLNNQLKTLQHSESQAISRIASNPTQAKYLLSVERQQKVKESLYLYLLQKREENELSQAFTAYNTRIVNRPGASGVPVMPDRRRMYMVAFLFGLILPFGFTYVKETLNTKVRGRADIEHLPIPFLGEIPLNGDNREKGKFGKKKFTKAVVVREANRNVINEAFRVTRTNLEFMKMHKDDGFADIIAFTSFNPGSGKTFLSVNLAVSLSLKGKRVLLIDGDMRHGSTSSYINNPKVGLANFLSGEETNIDMVIAHNQLNSCLDVLPVGTMPPNPTELLESPGFAQLFETLRTQYDYIFIDCPPIEIVADAQIIDKLVDRTVFVIRAGLLKREMLGQLEKMYDEKKYSNIATLLNGTMAYISKYGHSYKYGYGYGYGYGYAYTNAHGDSNKK